ncbi:MAG: MipA/OmpV family protein, partial [Pseudomonadota bacterium]
MTFRNFTALASAAALGAFATPTLAQTSTDPVGTAPALDPADLNRDRVTVALGVGTVPSYDGSDNNNFIPAGFIQGTVSGVSFYTRGLKLYVDVVPNAPGPVVDFQLGPVVSLNLDRTRRKTIDDT